RSFSVAARPSAAAGPTRARQHPRTSRGTAEPDAPTLVKQLLSQAAVRGDPAPGWIHVGAHHTGSLGNAPANAGETYESATPKKQFSIVSKQKRVSRPFPKFRHAGMRRK